MGYLTTSLLATALFSATPTLSGHVAIVSATAPYMEASNDGASVNVRTRRRPITIKPINENAVYGSIPQWFINAADLDVFSTAILFSENYGIDESRLGTDFSTDISITSILGYPTARPQRRIRAAASSVAGDGATPAEPAEIAEVWSMDLSESRGNVSDPVSTNIILHGEFDKANERMNYHAYLKAQDNATQKLGTASLKQFGKMDGADAFKVIDNAYTIKTVDEDGVLRRRVTYRLRKDGKFAIRYSHQKDDKSWHEDSRLVYLNTGNDIPKPSALKASESAQPFTFSTKLDKTKQQMVAPATAQDGASLDVNSFVGIIAVNDVIDEMLSEE